MYGINEVNNMFYYITENEICKHVTNDSTDVNKWLKEHQKTIKTIYTKHDMKEVIIEVK